MPVTLSSLQGLAIPQTNINADYSETLGDLGKVYQEAQNRRTLANLGTGLADGSINYKQAAGRLASTGNLNGVVSFLQLGEAEKKRQAELAAGQQADQLLSSLYYGGAPASGLPTPSAGDPRGIRNNNPLNLEASPFTQRQPGFAGSDGRFGRFGSMDQGFAAADNLLQSYGQRGINTVGGIINRWAPANDGNPVSAYAQFVARKAGVDPNTQIDMSDPAMRQRILGAMAEFENGRPVQVASADGGSLPVNAQPTQGALPQAAPQGGQLSPRGIAMMRVLGNQNLPAAQREQAKLLLGVELDSMKLTNDQKEWAMYHAQGGPDDFTTWKRANKAAGKTEVNIDQKTETGEAKAAGEAAGKRRADMFAAAGSAGKTLTNLSRMEGLLNQVSQGKLSPARMNISAWAKSLGLNDDVAKSLGLDPQGVGSAQAVQSLINESVVGKIGQGGFPANNFSDADREFITKIFPSLGDDPQANKIRIEGARRMAQLDIERAKAFQAFKRDPANKGRGFEDFELDWSDKMAQRDVFGDLRREAESIIGAPRNDIGGTINNPGAAPQRGATGQWGNQQPPVQGARQASDGKFYVPDPNRPGKYLEVR